MVIKLLSILFLTFFIVLLSLVMLLMHHGNTIHENKLCTAYMYWLLLCAREVISCQHLLEEETVPSVALVYKELTFN